MLGGDEEGERAFLVPELLNREHAFEGGLKLYRGDVRVCTPKEAAVLFRVVPLIVVPGDRRATGGAGSGFLWPESSDVWSLSALVKSCGHAAVRTAVRSKAGRNDTSCIHTLRTYVNFLGSRKAGKADAGARVVVAFCNFKSECMQSALRCISAWCICRWHSQRRGAAPRSLHV